MAFPTDLNNFTPKTDNVDDVMAQDVNELQGAIESLEAKVGADSSAVTTSHDYKIASLENGTHLHSATAKTTPVDADELGLIDTEASNVLKKLTWSNLKATFVSNKKATGAEITTGTDDTKFVTPKALADATVGKLGAAWADWTPSFTNFTLGNGTVVARYAQIGKTVYFFIKVTLGSTSSVSGLIAFSTPVEANTNSGEPVGVAMCYDNDAAVRYPAYLRKASSTSYSIQAMVASATYVTSSNTSSTVPFTWATNDYFSASGTYEAA